MSWKNNFPFTDRCQSLDSQISGLRNLKSEVSMGRRKDINKRELYNFLTQKEIQFARLKCSIKLENDSVSGTADVINERFTENEKRIIGEGNLRKNTMLITGGVVLVIGLLIIVR